MSVARSATRRNARIGSTVSVPSVGQPPARPTKRTKTKEAPTDKFCLSSYQRGYALESKRAPSGGLASHLHRSSRRAVRRRLRPKYPFLQAHPQKGDSVAAFSHVWMVPSALASPQARARVAPGRSPSGQTDSVQETDLSVCSKRSSRSCSVTKSLPVCDRSSATLMTHGKTHSSQQGGRCLWVRECMLCLSKFK